MNFEIDEMTAVDAIDVFRIFQQGISSGNATFETKLPDWETWDKDHLKICRYVLKDESDKVVGFCALRNISDKESLNGVADVSIYVDADHQNVGLGSMLLQKLILDSEDHNIWTLQSEVFPENKSGSAVHQKFGFRIVGTREKYAFLNGVWRDIILLERRSNKLKN